MNRAFLYIYLSVLAGANLVFAFLVPIARDPEVMTPTSNEWKTPEAAHQPSVEITQLLSSGFWGEVPGGIHSPANGAGPKEVEVEEAKQLRSQVKAIIRHQQTKEVLFGANKIYHRTKKGELLPGTKWTLIDIGEDWLSLSRDGSPENVELLKLFAVNHALKPAAATQKEAGQKNSIK